MRRLPIRLAVALLLALPAAGHATIVISKGIAGLQIGDSRSKALRLLGPPESEDRFKGGKNLYYAHGPVSEVSFGAIGLNQIETASPGQRTARGIGPGSSMSKLQQAYPKMHCSVEVKGSNACRTSTRRKHLRIYTTFELDGEQVSDVVIEAVRP
jgi:hypothetical protein